MGGREREKITLQWEYFILDTKQLDVVVDKT